MSIIGAALSLVGDAVSGFAYIGGAGRRSIGSLIPDIVVSESHHDHMTITKHPVETGAAISDHCFMEPPTVEMQCGASNSTAQSEGYVQQVYAEFLALQAKRKPFSVTTGKRQYKNMLIGDIIVTTDETRENVLDFTVRLENVIIVSTQTTSASSSTGAGAAPNSDQASQPATSSPTAGGNQSVLPAADGAPAFASSNGIDYNGPSTVPNGVLGSEITPNANVDTGGVTPTEPAAPTLAPSYSPGAGDPGSPGPGTD